MDVEAIYLEEGAKKSIREKTVEALNLEEDTKRENIEKNADELPTEG